MTREILINVMPRETRAALIEGGVTQELHIERGDRGGRVGNLYKGRVLRVLPGMQAAFIDIGLARSGFLHAADIAPVQAASDARAAPEDIRSLLTAGDDILVQVVKDPLGSKGARLSSFVSLPSRYLVYMPRGSGIGISARIEDEQERERLRAILQLEAADGSGGYILRTAAAHATPSSLRADLKYLARLWQSLRQRLAQAGAGVMLHEDLSLSLRLLRDELCPSIDRVLIDSEVEYARMAGFAGEFMPEASARIEYYGGPRPLFDLHGIEDEIERALERKVALTSGGYLVIDQTESMTTIDVNTGAYVGYRNLEETTFRTNMEAAATIARQLRLRNLGGVIIIDFIDMQDAVHHERLLAALQTALATDRAQTQIAGVSGLGLIQMTRKRTRESLEHLLCEPCQHCAGRGFRKSVQTLCHEIYRDVLRRARHSAATQVLILAHPQVVERLLDEEAQLLADLRAQLGKPVRLQAESQHGIDEYDVVLNGNGHG